MSKILRRDQFLKKNTINEAIATNDIPWGDSLIGRLINSIARKAKIAYNSKRIDKVIDNLRDQFDILVNEGKSDIDQSRLIKLQLWTFFSTLKKQVEDGEEVSSILNTANKLRDEVNSISELEDKDNILEAIDSFIEFLEGLEDSEEAEGQEEGDEEGEADEGGNEVNKVKTYPLMIKNLKSLGSLLSQYKADGKSGRGVSVNTESIEKAEYITKVGDTVAKIVASPENKLKWDSAKIWAKNQKTKTGDGPLKKQQDTFNKDPKKAGDKDKMTLGQGLKINLGSYKEEKGKLIEVNEIFFLSEAKFGVGGAENRGVIKSAGSKGGVKSGESHLEQAFSKLKKDIDVLISSKEKGIGVDSVFIDNITKSALDSKNKETIYKLYREIKRYLDGDKKLTIQERDALYKESIEILSDDKKIVVVAEKIARFCKRAFQFEGENLYGGMGDLGRPLEEFNKTMKEVMGSIGSNPVKKEEPKEEEPKERVNDSLIFKYSSFVNSLLEKNSNSEEIQTKFDEFFTAEIQDKISFTDDEVEELKKTKERPGGKYLIENASDPVMSIIRLFNRAYRLHTPGAIPSGRTEGKVSVSVFNEYEYMGSGSGGTPTGPGAGPYRNIKIFDKWKAGVDSILADTKYRPLFSEKTTLSFQSTETGKGDTVTKPGKMLLRFINKLNDDNTMYAGGGEKGSMYKFYEEYFGLAPKGLESGTSVGKELEENNPSASAITSVKTKWVKLKDSGLNGEDLFEIIKRDKDGLVGLSFRFNVTNNDNKEVTYYSCINDILSTKTPVMGEMFFSQTGYAFDTTKCSLPETNKTPTSTVNYGLISGKFKVGSTCNISYISLENATNTRNNPLPITYPVKSIEVLISVDENKPYKDFSRRLIGKFNNLNNNIVMAKAIVKK